MFKLDPTPQLDLGEPKFDSINKSYELGWINYKLHTSTLFKIQYSLVISDLFISFL